MSHTSEHVIDGVCWRTQRNADLSGDVQIFNTETNVLVKVPGELIITLTAEFVREQRITALTALSDDQILGIESE